MELYFECYLSVSQSPKAARYMLSHCYSFLFRKSDRRLSDESTEPGSKSVRS
jgi:hypothetical protein